MMTRNMKVTILGSGTCVPSIERSSCAVLVEVGESKILLDSGAGTMRRLLKTNTTIFDLTHIMYSHFHPDHTGELVPLLFATKYPNSHLRRKPLTICAGTGLHDFLAALKSVYGQWIELAPGLLEIIEVDVNRPDRLRFKDFTVDSIPVKHNPESIAIRITDTHRASVVYSGDTDYCENIITLAEGANILICESALPDDQKVAGHLTPSLAGDIASRAGVGQLVLTHFYPECDQVDMRKECRKTFSGSLLLAHDLMKLELS
jgi:ribonuclease BN (tRNA processing enzyme)